jgi:GNAT superfamily N-acetyltransferase
VTEQPPPFTVRPATADDAVALATFRSSMFRELGNNPPPGGQAAFEQLAAVAFGDGMSAGHCFAWLAETDDRRQIGSVALMIFPRLPSPTLQLRQEGYLQNVFTDPNFRGRGVATALVAAAIAKARALGMARIRLHATPEGRPVYAAAGFASRNDEMELRF